MSKYYVKCTDKFLSGMGAANGKINKILVECSTWENAHLVMKKLKERSEMKYITVTTKKPYLPTKTYYVSNIDENEVINKWNN